MKHRLSAAAAVLSLLAPLTARAQPTKTTLHTASGRAFTAYVAGPATARAGIVLVHDFFGVSPFFLEAVQRLGREGYRVTGVDLYDGRRATTHEEAGALMGALDTAVAATEIDAAVRSLAGGGRKLAIFGFSMGGRLSLEAALRSSAIVATIEWYGQTINDSLRLKQLKGPALLVVGSRDGPAAQNAAAFSNAADDAGAAAEIYVYPGAAHAFAQPLFNAGKTYDPVAANVAWLLTESFLRRRLR